MLDFTENSTPLEVLTDWFWSSGMGGVSDGFSVAK